MNRLQRYHKHPAYRWMRTRTRQYLHLSTRVRLGLDRYRPALAAAGKRRRIISTACWRFPIYSQTFVYQELTQLIRGGYDLKFLYAERERADELPAQFTPLWRGRRRMFLTDDVYDEDFRYYQRRSPEQVAALIRAMCDESGLSEDRLRHHIHFRQAFSFTRVAEAFRPDYLHSYFFYEGTVFTLVASWLLGIPRGVSCYADHRLTDYDLKMVPLQLRHSGLIVATSKRIKQEVLQLSPTVEPDRVVVKPNAINADHFPVVSRREPGTGEPHRLVCVSRMDPKKGLLYLVRAVKLLRDRGEHVELHLVGGVDLDQHATIAHAEEIDAEIRALGVDRWVHREGRRSEREVNTIFGRSHLFVAPFVELPNGDKDGIPTTLLEAMATGLPVVATDSGSITEVVENGREGVIVPQRDPSALASAIADLLKDGERRARFGSLGAEKVRARFDVSVCESVFHATLDRLLDGASQPARV